MGLDAYARIESDATIEEDEVNPFESAPPSFGVSVLKIDGETRSGFMTKDGPVLKLGRLTQEKRSHLLEMGEVEPTEEGHFPSSGTLKGWVVERLFEPFPDGVEVKKVYFA